MINPIYALFFIEVIFWCISYKITKGNMVSPSLVTFSMFIIATICVLLNVDFWDVDYSFEALGIMTLGFTTMFIPEFIVVISKKGYRKVLEKEDNKVSELVVPIMFDIIISFFCLLFLLTYIYEVYSKGAAIGVFGIDAIGIAKYDETYGMSFVNKFGARFIQITFLTYSYIVSYNAILLQKYKTIEFIPLLSFLILSIASGNRMALMKLFIILYVYWVVYSYKMESKNISLSRLSKKVLPYGGIMLLIFYLLRTATKINSTTGDRTFIDYITYYIGSPVYLFSKALDLPKNYNSYFGELTFSGFYSGLGIDINYINPYILVGGDSNFAGNVFSWFYRPYADFGILGMLVFTFLNYLLFSYILYKNIMLMSKKKYNFSLIFYSNFFFVIVMSFYYCQTCWAYTINNFICCVLSMVLLVLLTKYKVVL